MRLLSLLFSISVEDVIPKKEVPSDRIVLWSEIAGTCGPSSECVIPGHETWILDQRKTFENSKNY